MGAAKAIHLSNDKRVMETCPKLAPGSTILTLGTGGVSIFALQFGKAAGFDVLSTTSSEAKGERLRVLGAHEVINYRTHPEWEKEIAKLTGGLGIDHVIEVGGAGTLAKSMMAVRYGGAISLIGVLTRVDGRVNPLPVLGKNIRLQGLYVRSTAMFESMNAAIESLKIHPVIEKVYEFNDAPAALTDLESAQHVGKLVVRVN